MSASHKGRRELVDPHPRVLAKKGHSVSSDERHRRAEHLASHIMAAIASAYSVKESPPKLLNRRMTWNIEHMSVMLNFDTDDILVCGKEWTATIRPDQSFSIEGVLESGTVRLDLREILALVIGCCRQGAGERSDVQQRTSSDPV
jgi:hypothetical protein